ncbi:MAG: hypothetical protein HUU01_19820 [Saprospiraceae bacterium]|nr:hypothetical protein [Saprospiraceae bacterium]
MHQQDIRQFNHLVQVSKNEAFPHIFDVELNGMGRLESFDSIECHVVAYPYSRQVEAKHIAFRPYEEYVQDIAFQQRSSYARIGDPFRNIFGLLLGGAIMIVFACLKPKELFSVEAIISVFGAYTIGKEMWSDLENWLIKVTDNRRLRFQPRYYQYQLERNTTVTRYTRLARRQRYGMAMILPGKMDFIQQSNSQTIRMCFDHDDYAGGLAENKVHVLSIHIDPETLEVFEKTGHLLGIKVSLNRRKGLAVTSSIELFQSYDGSSRGCLDLREIWVPEAVLCRRTFRIGRLKWYEAQFVLPELELIERK